MTFSSAGDRLAVANCYGNSNQNSNSSINEHGFVQVFDFNNLTRVLSTTGIVSIGLAGNGALNGDLRTPYGLEFSKNSNFLYIGEIGTISTSSGNVWQYNLTTNAKVSLAYINGDEYGDEYGVGALQMGRDGKIYIAVDGQQYLGVINDPETAYSGPGIDFSSPANQIQLPNGKKSRLGLPNFAGAN